MVIHPERGIVVTVPATRAARMDGARRAAEFLGRREVWLRRHLARHADGPRFWSLVASRQPDHRTWRRWLHDQATGLYTSLVPRPDPAAPS